MNISKLIPLFNHKFPEPRAHLNADSEDPSYVEDIFNLREYAFAIKDHAEHCEDLSDTLIDVLQDFAFESGKKFYLFNNNFLEAKQILKDHLVYSYSLPHANLDRGIIALDIEQVTILKLAGIDVQK